MGPAFATPTILPAAYGRGRLPVLPGRSGSSLSQRSIASKAPKRVGTCRARIQASLVPASWAKAAVGIAGVVAGTVFPNFVSGRPPSKATSYIQTSIAADKLTLPVIDGNESGIPLGALGIKQEDFLSHRELSKLKTTQYSEAEEELMELEEDELENKWFHDLQVMWAGIASVGGIMVLYKGGVLWEKWIQEQERKDMEEEIELTGTFIDPRAVRKAEDEDDESDGTGSNGKDGDGGPDSPPETDDLPPGGIDALEKLFGKS